MGNFWIIRSDDYLAHHGILGQKWGVRRYQNEDGTLTEEGKRHYQNQKKLPKSARIKKKHTFYRVANSNEPIDGYRKYVTDTLDDLLPYVSDLSSIDMDQSKQASIYEYRSKKKLYYADAEKVCESILKNHGDKKLSDLKIHTDSEDANMLLELAGNLKIADIVQNYKSEEQSIISDFADAAMTRIAEFSLNEDYKVLDDLYEQGYDVVLDLADQGFMAEKPMILLNPEESVKLRNEHRL